MARMIVRGVREMDAKLDKMVADSELAARTYVIQGGAVIAKNAKREFTTVLVHKTGYKVQAQKGVAMPKGYKIDRKGKRLGGTRPQARSGNLSRSIKVHSAKVERGRWMSSTYPTMIYARRVELGFRGQDSKLRHYNQPPYPYLEPGFRKSLPELRELAGRIWRETAS